MARLLLKAFFYCFMCMPHVQPSGKN